MEFDFERRRASKEDIRELIFREILEYHPQLKEYINGTERTNFLYPRYWLGFPCSYLFSYAYCWTFYIASMGVVLLINSGSSLHILRKMVAKADKWFHWRGSMFPYHGSCSLTFRFYVYLIDIVLECVFDLNLSFSWEWDSLKVVHACFWLKYFPMSCYCSNSFAHQLR